MKLTKYIREMDVLEQWPMSKATLIRARKQPPELIDASRGKLRLEVRLFRKGLSGMKGASMPLDYLSQFTSERGSKYARIATHYRRSKHRLSRINNCPRL